MRKRFWSIYPTKTTLRRCDSGCVATQLRKVPSPYGTFNYCLSCFRHHLKNIAFKQQYGFLKPDGKPPPNWPELPLVEGDECLL